MKMGLDNFDIFYFGIWLQVNCDYVVSGWCGIIIDLSFQLFGGEYIDYNVLVSQVVFDDCEFDIVVDGSFEWWLWFSVFG